MSRHVSAIFRNLIRTVGEALFPAVCECCGRSLVNGETLLCLHCLHHMPLTNYHRDPFSELHKRLASPGLPIGRAAAMFHYIKDSPYTHLILNAKYNNRPTILHTLARDFALTLQSEHFFSDIDLLLPIPLNWRKLLRRGFNQSEHIALAISEATSIPVSDNLKALPHSTQTRKNAIQRAANVDGTIRVTNPAELAGRHILLIDDVITTGATLLTAAKAIHSISPTTRISILTLAATKLN